MSPEREFTVLVAFASHDDLKAGILARGIHLVNVTAEWASEANLLACQLIMATQVPCMATASVVVNPRGIKMEPEAHIVLTNEAFDAFVAQLERPAQVNEKLAALLRRPRVLDMPE